MAYLNKVMVIGQLVRDPETRIIPPKNQVTSFTVVSKRVYKQQDGNVKEEILYIKCACWGKEAQAAEQLRKGQEVLVEGRLRFASWKDKKSGEEKSGHEIWVESVSSLEVTSEPEVEQPRKQFTQSKPMPKAKQSFEDDELPF